MKKRIWGAVALAVCLICALGLLRKKSSEPVSRSTVAMGAIVQQTVYGAEKAAQSAITEAAAAVSALENRISWRVESSEVAALNRGETVSLSDDVTELLSMCISVNEQSDGAFDAMLLPVTRLWDFEAEIFLPPAAEAVQSARAFCGKTWVLGDSMTLPEGCGLDLGGIGKGAGCDAALKSYQSADVEAALVAVGGSIGVTGRKPDGSAWQIAVRDPNNTSSKMLGTLALAEGCVSTSGTYEKTRAYGDTVYHHLLDPKTGMPADTDIISATVVADSGALSDALATAAVVMGKTAAEAFLQAQGVAYLLVTEEKTLCANEAFRAMFTRTETAYAWEDAQ